MGNRGDIYMFFVVVIKRLKVKKEIKKEKEEREKS
jgi:hypothetical protein